MVIWAPGFRTHGKTRTFQQTFRGRDYLDSAMKDGNSVFLQARRRITTRWYRTFTGRRSSAYTP